VSHIIIALSTPIGTKPNAEDLALAKKRLDALEGTAFEPSYDAVLYRMAQRIAQRRKYNEKLRARRARARARKKVR
jgi:hypothetical protein